MPALLPVCSGVQRAAAVSPTRPRLVRSTPAARTRTPVSVACVGAIVEHRYLYLCACTLELPEVSAYIPAKKLHPYGISPASLHVFGCTAMCFLNPPLPASLKRAQQPFRTPGRLLCRVSPTPAGCAAGTTALTPRWCRRLTCHPRQPRLTRPHSCRNLCRACACASMAALRSLAECTYSGWPAPK